MKTIKSFINDISDVAMWAFLSVAFCASLALGQSTRPVVLLRPAPNTVIENLNLNGNSGAIQYGIYISCYPAPSDPTYVCKGLIIRNNVVKGFNVNVCLIGPNISTQIYGNTITDSTGTWQTMQSGGHSHGLYAEGLQQGAQIHDNHIANNGWWATYDPTDANQRTLANMNHGCYFNESAGMDDSTLFYNNTVIDNVGSDVGCRLSLRAWDNVFRGVGDYSLIVGQYGKLPAAIFGNACFAPRKDAVPYYGGGIHLLCPGQVKGNYFAGSAATTFNAAATDTTGVVPQIGFWPKLGATLSKPGTRQAMIEDWCLMTYGKADVSTLKPGDAPKIVAWLASQLVSAQQATPAVTPSVDVKVNGVSWGPK